MGIELVGRDVVMKSGESGFIQGYDYSTELNHYFYTIKIDTSEIITFVESDFKIK